MNIATLALAVSIGTTASLAQAEGRIVLEKTKTAILPSGGFYSLYSGTCHDQSEAAVASLDRGRRWCYSVDGDLSCVDRRQEAIQLACARASVASSQEPDTLETVR